MNRREALILLNMIPSFGMKGYEKILEAFAKPELVFKASQADLEKKGLGKTLVNGIIRLKSFNPQDEIKKVESAGIKIVVFDEKDYPQLLREIFSPPLVLYMKGEYRVEDQLALAIVGTRRPTIYGRNTAEKLAGELAKRKITVVSGLARGIDTAAHQGALKSRGRTIAVLGSGLGNIYPPENVKLAQEISERGLLLSEFLYDYSPFSSNFPRRNRLISGLSLGTVIVEAPARSGALITANFALEQGREVFAIPGKIDSPTSAGTHQLIKEGAKMVVEIEDILEEFKYKFPEVTLETKPEGKKEVNITSTEDKIVSFIKTKDETGRHIDEVIRHMGLSPGEVAGLLFNLELKGLIRQLSGKRFVSS